jgi:RimJ/RimL family protein N-acetyltransferase
LSLASEVRVRLVLDRCEIRSWVRRDVPAIVRHANDYEVWRNLRDRFPHPYTTSAGEAWVRAATREHPEASFAIAVDGEAVGGIGLQRLDDVYRRSAEVGYWLGRAYWGRGLATEALRGFAAWAFPHYDVCRLFSYVFETNPASCRVLEKADFILEGRMRMSVTKEGRTLDQFLFARVHEPRSAPAGGPE